MKIDDKDNNHEHHISTSAVDVEDFEDNKITHDRISAPHNSIPTAKPKSRGGGPSTWVRRSTRNVKKGATLLKQTPEEELAAVLAESSMKETAKATRNGPNSQKRPKKIHSQHTDKQTEGEGFEAAKELERQRQLMFLAMLERREGYVRSGLTGPNSAVRSSLDHDVSNDDFTAALILREMANQGPASDSSSKAFIQRPTNVLGSEGTEKSKSVIKKKNSPIPSTLRRSGRNMTGASIDKEKSSPPKTRAQPSTQQPLNLDQSEGFLPSTANGFMFKYDSPSGLRARELDTLLKLPPRPKSFPADLANEKVSIAKSYKFLGQKPKANAADQMVEQMELEIKQRQEEVETVMAEDDRWNELWGIKDWE